MQCKAGVPALPHSNLSLLTIQDLRESRLILVGPAQTTANLQTALLRTARQRLSDLLCLLRIRADRACCERQTCLGIVCAKLATANPS